MTQKQLLNKKRWYVHGDKKEREENLFYCRRCDFFQPYEHFGSNYHDNSKGNEDYERYLWELKVWKQTYSRDPQYYRPTQAYNCLA